MCSYITNEMDPEDYPVIVSMDQSRLHCGRAERVFLTRSLRSWVGHMKTTQLAILSEINIPLF